MMQLEFESRGRRGGGAPWKFLASDSVNRNPLAPPTIATSALSFISPSCLNERCECFSRRAQFSDREMKRRGEQLKSKSESLFSFFRERDGAARLLRRRSLSLPHLTLTSSFSETFQNTTTTSTGPTADNILTSASGGRRSLNPGNRPLLTAYIACRGPKPLIMHAGPALAPFAGNFSGVEYIKEVQLPGGTIEIRGQDVTIENSFFVNLNYMVSGREVFLLSFCFSGGKKEVEK